MPSVEVQCPNPACPGRIVEGDSVTRESWEATWHAPYVFAKQPGEFGPDIACPSCGTEGIDPESGQLDSAEEELGERCDKHGIVGCTADLCNRIAKARGARECWGP